MIKVAYTHTHTRQLTTRVALSLQCVSQKFLKWCQLVWSVC